MRMIALVATRALTYGDRSLGAGDRFTATPIDAAVLTYHRQAAFAPRGPVAPLQPVPVVVGTDGLELPAEKPPRRRSKRRDLEAEEA
jgi:hypothetical protein